MPLTPVPKGQSSFLITADWVIAALSSDGTLERSEDRTGEETANETTDKISQRPIGPPVRANGMTVGIIDMDEDAPHNGEMHPDGDELLHVISGKVEVSCERDGEVLTLGPGESCIVAKGEWHNVHIVEPAKLIHITPGPGGEHRPLA